DTKKKTDVQSSKTGTREDGSTSPSKPAEPTSEVKEKTDADEIIDLLTHRYNRTLRTFQEWDSEDVMGVYLTALAHAYDPHSDYFNERETANFAMSMNLSLFGIG